MEDTIEQKILYNVCVNGDLESIKLLTEASSLLEHAYGKDKRPIHLTVENKQFECTEHLIKQKCNIESEDENGMRPIHYACLNGEEDIVKLLIENKCEIDCRTKDMNQPIHFACMGGHINIVKRLLKRNCEVYEKNNNNDTPLSLATKNNHNDCVIYIEDFIRNEIVQCIRRDDEIKFEILYLKSISNTDKIHRELSVLDIADWKKADKIIKYLMEKTLDDEEMTYLTELYKNIINIEHGTLLGEMILYRCIRDRHTDGFHKFCLSEIVNKQQKLIKSSFLAIVSKEGCSIFVKELLKKTIYNKETWDMAINEAIEHNHNDIAEDIKDRGSMIESRLKSNFSLLHSAVCDNDDDMVRYILEKNTLDPDINHETFGTALALAHSLCNKKCIKVLEHFNVQTNTQNKFMQTPLHEAIASGTFDWSEYLIENCDNIDRAGFNNLTALHCAVIEGKRNWCENLVQNGADSTRKTSGKKYFYSKDTEIKSEKKVEIDEIELHNDFSASDETGYINEFPLSKESLELVHPQTFAKKELLVLDNLFLKHKGITNSTYELLKMLLDDIDQYEDVNLLFVVNGVTIFFLKNCKETLAEKVRNETNLEKEDRLVINCLHVSLMISAAYFENNLATDYSYNDYIIRNIFATFSRYVSKSSIMTRICESILYLLCCVLKLRNKKIDYDFWNEELMICCEDETVSQEMRLAASVGLVEINSIRNLSLITEKRLRILKYLIKVIFEGDKEEYLGFKKEEMIRAIENAVKIVTTSSQKIFSPDEGLDIRLNYFNDILCVVLQSFTKIRSDYYLPIMTIAYSTVKSFMINCKQNIIDKFEQKDSFNKCEKLSINSFCNSLNILGTLSTFETLKPSSDDLCITIYTCLDKLEKFSHTNIYAIRICEVLLYCLCNLKPLTKEDKWRAILWKFYKGCTTSKQIKIATAVSLTYIFKNDVEIEEVDNIKIFFENICQEMIKTTCDNYLGFSLQEIKDSVIRCCYRTIDNQTVNLKTNSILNLTTVEDALTLCLKLNGTIYTCLWPKVETFECCDASGNTLLHLAVVSLQPDICKILLEKESSIIHQVNKEGNNCLQELFLNLDESAVENKIDQIIAIVELLIKFGIDLSAKTQAESNIFQLAFGLKNERLVVMLFTPTSAKTITENDFELSFERQMFEFVEKMLSEECLYKFIKADFIIKYLNDIPLCLMKTLFDKSDEAFKVSIFDDLMYHIAVQDDENWFDKLLILDLKTSEFLTNEETLLTNLIRYKKQKYYNKLIGSSKKQEYVEKLNKNNQTPLQVAIETEEIDCAIILIRHSKINNKDNKEETALTQLMKKMLTCDTQIRNKLNTLLESMIDKGVQLYSITSDKTNCKKNIKEMVRTILDRSENMEKHIAHILKPLQSQKCSKCPARTIEYVFECEHKFCSNCGEKIEKCTFKHLK